MYSVGRIHAAGFSTGTNRPETWISGGRTDDGITQAKGVQAAPADDTEALDAFMEGK